MAKNPSKQVTSVTTAQACAYAEAVKCGRKCASIYIDGIRRNPQFIGSGELATVAANFNTSPIASPERGYVVGFFSFIEQQLFRD